MAVDGPTGNRPEAESSLTDPEISEMVKSYENDPTRQSPEAFLREYVITAVIYSTVGENLFLNIVDGLEVVEDELPLEEYNQFWEAAIEGLATDVLHHHETHIKPDPQDIATVSRYLDGIYGSDFRQNVFDKAKQERQDLIAKAQSIKYWIKNGDAADES